MNIKRDDSISGNLPWTLPASSMITSFVMAMCLVGLALPPRSANTTAKQRGENKSEMAASGFANLISEYFNDLHARHPALSAPTGLHAWDDQLEDYSASALQMEAAAIKKFQAR